MTLPTSSASLVIFMRVNTSQNSYIHVHTSLGGFISTFCPSYVGIRRHITELPKLGNHYLQQVTSPKHLGLVISDRHYYVGQSYRFSSCQAGKLISLLGFMYRSLDSIALHLNLRGVWGYHLINCSQKQSQRLERVQNRVITGFPPWTSASSPVRAWIYSHSLNVDTAVPWVSILRSGMALHLNTCQCSSQPLLLTQRSSQPSLSLSVPPNPSLSHSAFLLTPPSHSAFLPTPPSHSVFLPTTLSHSVFLPTVSWLSPYCAPTLVQACQVSWLSPCLQMVFKESGNIYYSLYSCLSAFCCCCFTVVYSMLSVGHYFSCG